MSEKRWMEYHEITRINAYPWYIKKKVRAN